MASAVASSVARNRPRSVPSVTRPAWAETLTAATTVPLASRSGAAIERTLFSNS